VHGEAAAGVNCLTSVNRISKLIKTNKFDSMLRNENYCKANSGVSGSTSIIKDIIPQVCLNRSACVT
jgi:hypothetical protein